MTWDEICQAWPDEYVLLDDLLLDADSNTVRGGRVLSHSSSRKDAFAQAGVLAGRSWALKWTGRIHVPPGWTGIFIAR